MSKIIVDQIQSLNSDDVNIPGTLSVDGEIAAGGINNSGPLKDSNDSVGIDGQVLTSTGEGTNWVSLDLEFATDAQLQAEADLRTNADSSLQSNIDQEILDRVAADNTLQSNIQSEAQTRLTADNTLNQAILDEADLRASSDDALQEAIDQEAQSRANADLVLQANIDAEESARISADNTLEATKVPYTGATQNVDLGANKLTAQIIQVSGGTGTQGTLSWNTEDQTLDLIVSEHVTYQIGQELGHVARNLSGQDIGNGKVVKVVGASGDKITIELADSSTEYNSSSTFAVVTEPINNNSTGRVTTEGLVRGLDTSAFVEGVAIWLGQNGQFTDVKPLSPDHLVHIGWVVRSHATEGSILVRVSNGWELEELHDVLITNVQGGDILQWDAVSGVWVNSTGLDDIYQSLSSDILDVQSNLDAEIISRGAADDDLQSQIDAEVLARTNADLALQAQITSNDADITALQNDLADEVIARQQGDTQLHNEIVAEASTRASEDAILQGQIDSNDADIADLYTIKENVANKGIANGYAPLDSGAKVPEAYLPDSIVGQLSYQGTWDASTNTPTLPDPVTNKGDYYVTNVEGTYLTVTYHVGDWIISNGVDYQKVDNTDAVTSVFGRLGNVNANESDYSAFYPLIQDLTDEATARANADTTLQGQITSNDSDISALQSGLAQEITDRADADSNLQGQITSNDGDISTLQSGLAQEILDRADADQILQGLIDNETAARIAGDANLQGQINILPAPNNATIIIASGSGLTGSGDFTTDQAINETITISHADTSVQASVTGTTNTFVDGVTLDTYGHVTGLTTQSVTIPNPNNATITLSAGSGMTGGGDFTTDQGTNEIITISHSDTSTLSGVYGSTASGTKINEITIDGFGHITAITTGATGDIDGITAGSGLTGGGTSGTPTISHADTSTQLSVNNSGLTFIQDVTLDDFGHVTGLGSGSVTLPVVNDGVITISAGGGLTGSGDFSTNQSTAETITISHADTSAQGSVNNSNGVVIQDVTLDTYGHITSLGSVDLDDRYYTESEADGRFVRQANYTNWNSIVGSDDVVGQLAWKNYGNNHTIYDASAGTAPNGVAKNNTNPDNAWSATYPTLMGWNGSSTYGVRVDRSRYAEALTNMNISQFTNDSGYITGINAGSGISISTPNTISHADTSSQASVNNSGGTVIQDITLDTYGHLTGLVSYNLDARYYTESESNSLFVNATGDTMTGQLSFNNTNFGISYVAEVGEEKLKLFTPDSQGMGQPVFMDAGPYVTVFNSRGTFEIRTPFYLGGGGYYEKAAGFDVLGSNINTPYISFTDPYTYNDMMSLGSLGVNYTMQMNGNIYCNTLYQSSDRDLKENILPIQGALSIVSQLQGVSFDWVKTGEKSNGFIAQEVEQIVPEAVSVDEEGNYAVNYIQMIAIQNEAIKELKIEIDLLREELKALKNG